MINERDGRSVALAGPEHGISLALHDCVLVKGGVEMTELKVHEGVW